MIGHAAVSQQPVTMPPLPFSPSAPGTARSRLVVPSRATCPSPRDLAGRCWVNRRLSGPVGAVQRNYRGVGRFTPGLSAICGSSEFGKLLVPWPPGLSVQPRVLAAGRVVVDLLSGDG